MRQEEREEFWRAFRHQIDRFSERGTRCEIRSNTFEVRQWDVEFVAREARDVPRSATLRLLEHAPSTAVLLLAVSRTIVVDGEISELDRVLIPVLRDPQTGAFSLHADHGPVHEAQMPEFFCGMVSALLHRL